MNLFDGVIQVMFMLVVPFAGGAVKFYFASGMLRIFLKVAPTCISTVYLTYFIGTILIDTDTKGPVGAALDTQYLIPAIAILGALIPIFFVISHYGEKVAVTERAGVQSDIKKGAKTVGEELTPMLESFMGNVKTSVKKNVSACLAGQSSAIADLEKELKDYASTLGELAGTVSGLTEAINGFHDTMGKVAEYFAKNPDAYQELIARIEAIKYMQQPDDEEKPEESRQKVVETGKRGKDGFADGTAPATTTKITTQGGRANHEAGHKQQDEMGQLLRDRRFDVKVRHGIGEPDFIIRLSKSGVIISVAAVANKFYTLHDEPRKRQRRISVKDCRPELALAKKLKIPMVLIVTNRINGRMWMYIVNVDELKTWKGISTPVMLVKGDDGTGQELEEEFASNIVKLGGRA